MSRPTFAPAAGGRRFPRVLGSCSTGKAGPVLLVVGGIHGNEPAGALAATRVFERLVRDRLPLRGEAIAVAGNLGALAADRRYLAFDLNRCWTPERVGAIRRQPPDADAGEEREQRALLEILDDASRKAGGRLTLLDLHSTSSGGPPFILMSDTLRNRRLGMRLLGTVFLGLEEAVDGTLLEHMTEAGHTAVVVEGGQNQDPTCVQVHEAVMWTAFEATGALRAEEIPDYREHREFLRSRVRGTPAVVELRYRHHVRPEDRFRMNPGYVGFQPVAEGEVLARDVRGEVRSPEAGRVVMPLYQEQGDDGFFLVRDVNRFWIGLSAALRKLALWRLLFLLPGVSRIAEKPDAVAVDTSVARYYAVEIFHLFGYRKRVAEPGRLVFTRRRQG